MFTDIVENAGVYAKLMWFEVKTRRGELEMSARVPTSLSSVPPLSLPEVAACTSILPLDPIF